jgi:hypothetical protein
LQLKFEASEINDAFYQISQNKKKLYLPALADLLGYPLAEGKESKDFIGRAYKFMLEDVRR